MNEFFNIKLEKEYQDYLKELKTLYKVTTVRQALRLCIEQSISIAKSQNSFFEAKKELEMIKKALKFYFEAENILKDKIDL